jgi:hypothetical protein
VSAGFSPFFSDLRWRWNFLGSRESLAMLGIESEQGDAALMVSARLHAIIEERRSLRGVLF